MLYQFGIKGVFFAFVQMEHVVRVEGYERSLPSTRPVGLRRGERLDLHSC